jgi:hypothetical protein
MLKSHLILEGETTVCGRPQSKVLGYALEVFKKESPKFQCAKCLKVSESASQQEAKARSGAA